jgi:hypothetical protein
MRGSSVCMSQELVWSDGAQLPKLEVDDGDRCTLHLLGKGARQNSRRPAPSRERSQRQSNRRASRQPCSAAINKIRFG